MKAIVGNHERFIRSNFRTESFTRNDSNNSHLFVATAADSDSSQDYFTVQFHNNAQDTNGGVDTEKVPVRKGRSLKESIELLLVSRGLSFDTHSVFLESSKTPLPLAFDTIPLTGNTLHVKANQSMQVDERIVELMKAGDEQQDKKLQSQRQKKNIISLINNDDASQSNNKSTSLPVSTSKVTRKGNISLSSKDLSKSLPDLLQEYSAELDEEDGMLSNKDSFLEETWTQVIIENETMTRQQKIQQEAIWELLSTEINYVGKIGVIMQVFRKCLRKLKQSQYLVDVDEEKLFANIHEVYDTNRTFWRTYLMQVVENTRLTQQPIKPSQLLDSFEKFEDLFDPYIKYCLEESHCVKYLKYLKHVNQDFADYLAWCENQQECHRLKLADLLVKPMQRVTKYALLLRAILTRTIDDDQCHSLEDMISQVERFVTKINTTLRLRHEQQKLDAVLARIESYVPVEAANEEVEKIVMEYSNLNLRQKIPGLREEQQRCILLDGSMKMIEKQGRFDVQVFLFTDALLITKPKKGGEKFRVIRPPYRLNKVFVHTSKDLGSFIVIYLNEYGALVNAFTLQVNANELTKWIQAIQKAKGRYMDARAGHGSTLEFDEDLPSSTTIQTLHAPMNYTNVMMSPLPDAHSMNISADDSSDMSHSLHPCSDNVSTHLRSSSSSNFTDSLRGKERLTDVNDASVKRSLSDPKSSVQPRLRSKNIKSSKLRPMSLVQTTDPMPWMFQHERRQRSGSIPSDISDDRSSGIGDSFRSINSDNGISSKNGYPEISNVQKLKARFENGEYQSDSSSSLTSNGAAETTSTAPVSRSNSNKKTNDYPDQPCTIEEEEEQVLPHTLVVSPRALTVSLGSDTEEDNLSANEEDSNRTLHGKHDTYQNLDSLKSELIRFLDSSTQTDPPVQASLTRATGRIELKDCSTQCILYMEISNDNLPYLNRRETCEKYCSNSDLFTCHSVAVQCNIGDSYDTVDMSPTSQRSVGSQCGDFIHLQDIGESATDDICDRKPTSADDNDNVADDKNHTTVKGLSTSTPMLNMLMSGGRKLSNSSVINNNNKPGISKARSEINLAQLKEYHHIAHSRSQSDELNPPTRKLQQRNSDAEYPGMKALQSLSESLESSLILRSSSVGKKSENSDSTDISIPNAYMTTIHKSSPVVSLRSADEKPRENALETQSVPSVNESPTGTVVMRDKKKEDGPNKRYTWHEFDSKAALENIRSTRYGYKSQSGQSTTLPVVEESRRLERTFSKSTEQLHSPRKQKSFKKTLFKKFSDSRIIDRDDTSVSSMPEPILDDKQLKKMQEKEKKEEKKRMKMEKKREKEEKKREKQQSKRRTSSHSSQSSSNSSQSNVHKT